MTPDRPTRFAIDTFDWKGRQVRMTRATFESHKTKHLEVPEYVEEAKLLIADPDLVYVDDDGGAVHVYRAGLGRGKYSKTWLWAVIHYWLPASGTLASYHFTSRLREDLRLDERRYLLEPTSGRRSARGSGGLS